MRLAAISSGSKGNCILVNNEKSTFLVDAGISKKRIEEGLDAFNVSPEDVDGILITHEHSDHIKGLGVWLRKYKMPVYATDETIKCILNDGSLGKIDSDLFNVVEPGKELVLKDLQIKPLSISHDAANPVCYRFNSDLNEKSCAVVTDLGKPTETLVHNLQELNTVLIESNHDVGMLQAGPYPYYLKQRIWGERGHLSNEACGDLINSIINKDMHNIILGHLSGENNYPDLAFQAVRNEINFAKHKFYAEDVNLKVASRNEPSCDVEF